VVTFFVVAVGGAALLLRDSDDTATGPEVTNNDDPEVTSTDPETTGPDATGPDTTGPDTTGPDTTGPPVELSLADAIADINAFWNEEFEPLFGDDYEPIPDENIFPLSEAGRTIECGGQDIETGLLRGNAIYCPDDDFIAYDNEELFPRLRDEFGDLSPALVMAHEWGHAIQSRTPTPNGPTIFVELQADCFAGAWAKRLLDGEGDMLAINPSEIDVAVKGYLEFSDPIGTTSRDPGAHGTGFDRINAFGEGVRAGAGGCLDYFDGGIDPVDVPIDRDFFVNEGNLDFETSLNLFPESLNEFWTEVGESEGVVVPELVNIATRRDADTFSCAVAEGELMNACADEGAIVYADDIEDLHEEIGDFATALVLGVEYAEAMAELFGFEPTEERLECLAGAWTGRTLSGADEVLRLSAGDLDEAIVTLIELSDGSRTVFEQVGNFQEGVFEGYDACTG
jgi:predicted metalloprotease